MDLAFIVDITKELNIPNLMLKGPYSTHHSSLRGVKAFSPKLRLWKTQLSAKTLSPFTACRSLVVKDTASSGDGHFSAVENLMQGVLHKWNLQTCSAIMSLKLISERHTEERRHDWTTSDRIISILPRAV